MPVSSARLLANRRNALKSSGPKTPAGKSQSRQNALKHGLTGEGIVVPAEDAARISQRFETLNSELQPSGEAGRILLRRFAFLSIRLEKCEDFDTSNSARRVRHAAEVFDDQRQAQIEELLSMIDSDPRMVTRRLQCSPEGVDRLAEHLGGLREDLLITERLAWTMNHWSRLEHLMGRQVGNVRITRSFALSQAINGYFGYLKKADGEGLDEPERIEWVRHELATIIDAELARLKEVKAALDPALIAQDRLEVPRRVLFDASPEMTLARKYEAATERAMYKALDRFHDVELAAIEAEPVPINPIPESACDTVGSFLPEPEPTEEPLDEPAVATPRSVVRVGSRSSTPRLPVEKPSNQVPITIGPAENEMA